MYEHNRETAVSTLLHTSDTDKRNIGMIEFLRYQEELFSEEKELETRDKNLDTSDED